VTWKQRLLPAAAFAIAAAQPTSNMVLANLATARWGRDKGDAPGMESVLLREDAGTGGMELLVRFPPGHVIAPHWHESNERIIVLEGRLTLRQDTGETALERGGVAFLPARGTVYLSWDGNPKSHAAR
jgi:quercetin dioxygenase-like cupin family protein